MLKFLSKYGGDMLLKLIYKGNISEGQHSDLLKHDSLFKGNSNRISKFFWSIEGHLNSNFHPQNEMMKRFEEHSGSGYVVKQRMECQLTINIKRQKTMTKTVINWLKF